MTFRQCGTKYIEANKVGWKNAKHAAQWLLLSQILIRLA